jgi:hypothetical protein
VLFIKSIRKIILFLLRFILNKNLIMNLRCMQNERDDDSYIPCSIAFYKIKFQENEFIIKVINFN